MNQGEHLVNGSTIFLYNGENMDNYDDLQRESWDSIVILSGVKSIPDYYFQDLNVSKVYMSDSVEKIGESVFSNCNLLQSIRLSRNLESIGEFAISDCESLESIYIPRSCKKLGNYALSGCKNLINIHVPKQTDIELFTLTGTFNFQRNIVQASDVHSENIDDYYFWGWTKEYTYFHEHIKNLDNTLMHQLCSSEFPCENEIFEEMLNSGLKCLYIENEAGYTAIQCLAENPYSLIKLQDLINRYVLYLVGNL